MRLYPATPVFRAPRHGDPTRADQLAASHECHAATTTQQPKRSIAHRREALGILNRDSSSSVQLASSHITPPNTARRRIARTSFPTTPGRISFSSKQKAKQHRRRL